MQKQQQAREAAAAVAAASASAPGPAAAGVAAASPVEQGPQKGNLVHAWVMVLAGKREVRAPPYPVVAFSFDVHSLVHFPVVHCKYQVLQLNGQIQPGHDTDQTFQHMSLLSLELYGGQVVVLPFQYLSPLSLEL